MNLILAQLPGPWCKAVWNIRTISHFKQSGKYVYQLL
jgi:hypothetical protein